MKKILRAFFYLFITLALFGREETLPLDHPSFKIAEEKYVQYCSGCHGATMIAFADRNWKHGSSEAELIQSITKGFPEDGMAGFAGALSSEEIGALAKYIVRGIEIRAGYTPDEDTTTPLTFPNQSFPVRIEPVLTDLERPWGIEVTKDGTMFVTERMGILTKRTPAGEVIAIKNVPAVRNFGQGGLLDVLLHPDFENNRWLYLSFAKEETVAGETVSGTVVVRATLVDNQLQDVVEIFRADPFNDKRFHFGSRMVFDADGYLYISTGDRGQQDDFPQSLASGNGKIHRVYADGSAPEDNPFTNTAGALPTIYSFGHRNPQGLAIHPVTNELWEHEHGPRGGDEINLIQGGENYGWPLVSYGINYNGTTFTTLTEKPGITSPKQNWTPSIAPCGMAFVQGSKYPGWENSLLSGSLRFNYVSRVVIENGEIITEEKILQNIGRVRSLEMGDDGYLYVGVEDRNGDSGGIIYRVVPLQP